MFVALCVAQVAVILTFALSSIGFLWYNVIGCGAVVVLALLASAVLPSRTIHPAT